MKRLSVFISILLFMQQSPVCQVAFYDASTLRATALKPAAGSGELRIPINAQNLQILVHYVATDLDGDSAIIEAFKTNPFFVVTGTPRGVGKGLLRSGISSIGSLNVTGIADGIARFLIKRGEEELNIAFFNRMNKFLDQHEECKTLFPATVDFLKNIDVARYAEFLQSLREAFYKDLSNLVVGLNQLIDLPKYNTLLKNFPEIRLALRSLRIVNELSQSGRGILPDSIIHQLAQLNEWSEIDPNLGNSWKMLDVISQSLRYKSSDGGDSARRWVTPSDLNALIQDTIKLRIYLGLLYQKMEEIAFKIKGSTKTVRAFMAENKFNILSVASLAENFMVLANDVDRTIQDIREKQRNGGFSNEDFYTYISKAINITEYGFRIANVITPGITDDRYIKIARNGNNLYRNIYTKNYNNAVMDVYTILNQIFGDKYKLIAEKADKSGLSSIAKDSMVGALGAVNFPSTKVMEAVLKYGNFMASVIKAESAEDVQSALDAAALPSGSYSIKQKSEWNLSANGYVGYAWDFLKFPFKNQYARGIYAPVGVAITHGMRKAHGLAFSGFVSLIDVGGIAAYRLQNGNDIALKQEVRLESIFSPSGQLFIEYGGWPFAIGGGWRMTPKLFYSDNTSFSAVPSKNVFNFSVLIDIPLMTIKNWPFNRK